MNRLLRTKRIFTRGAGLSCRDGRELPQRNREWQERTVPEKNEGNLSRTGHQYFTPRARTVTSHRGFKHLSEIPTIRQLNVRRSMCQHTYRTGTRCFKSSNQFTTKLICRVAREFASSGDRMTMNCLPSGVMSKPLGLPGAPLCQKPLIGSGAGFPNAKLGRVSTSTNMRLPIPLPGFCA